MSSTIQAIYERGLIRPLEATSLTEGEELEIMLLKKKEPGASKVLSKIADLEIEGESDNFAGRDHDEVLYPTK
jgi:predicted DNA-binding antitoxin AbrB/MazE fold protein